MSSQFAAAMPDFEGYQARLRLVRQNFDEMPELWSYEVEQVGKGI